MPHLHWHREPATFGGLAVYISETGPSVCIGESWDTKRPNSELQQFIHYPR